MSSRSSSDGVVLRGRVKSGRESSSSSFCISVTRTRDTSSDASGVSGVPLFSVSEASLSKPGGFSLLSSALDGVAVSAANAGILQVKQRRQARQPSRIRLCICFILIRYPPFQRKHIDGRFPAAVFHCGGQSEVPPRLSNGRSDCQPG